MTLLNPTYFVEVVSGLSRDGLDVRHFTLTAHADTIGRRGMAREGGLGDWALMKNEV